MNSKATKRSLFASVIALMLCFSMLLGTTFAWFTDTVTSAGNIIQSGKLDVEMYYADGTKAVPADDSTDWTDASTGAIFNYDKWEPGFVQVRHIKIANEGTLALKYAVNIVPNGTVSELADVIDVYYADSAVQVSERKDVDNLDKLGTLTEVLAKLGETGSGNLEAEEKHTITLAFKMQESAGNEYQGKSIGTDFSVKLFATQLTSEVDSFDDQYDADAELPVLVNNVDELTRAVAAGGNIMLAEDIELTSTLIAKKDAVIDLNGNTITAPSNGAMFQSNSNAAPSMIITSSVAGAEINVSGGDTSVLLGYGSTEINNVTINVNGCDNLSPNPFKVYGDLTLGEGTVVNIDYLGTALISNNGANAIVIDGAEINVDTFKTNGGAMISLTKGTTLALKNTKIKVGLDTTFKSYFISRADNATIEGCTFDVTDASGATYGIEFKPDANVGAKYAWVLK